MDWYLCNMDHLFTYNYSKQFDCTTRFNEYATARSILFRSENVRKGGEVFQHFSLQAKRSELGHFSIFVGKMLQFLSIRGRRLHLRSLVFFSTIWILKLILRVYKNYLHLKISKENILFSLLPVELLPNKHIFHEKETENKYGWY